MDLFLVDPAVSQIKCPSSPGRTNKSQHVTWNTGGVGGLHSRLVHATPKTSYYVGQYCFDPLPGVLGSHRLMKRTLLDCTYCNNCYLGTVPTKNDHTYEHRATNGSWPFTVLYRSVGLFPTRCWLAQLGPDGHESASERSENHTQSFWANSVRLRPRVPQPLEQLPLVQPKGDLPFSSY